MALTYPIGTQLNSIRIAILVFTKGCMVDPASELVLIFDDNEVVDGRVGKGLL